MQDRLIELLKYFELKANVFRSGPVCHSAQFEDNEGLGYIHLLRSGTLKVDSPRHPLLVLDEPSMFIYVNPTRHLLQPQDGGVDTVCATFNFGTGLHNPIKQALPNVVVIALREMPSMASTLELLFQEADDHLCGQQVILDRLIEVLIVQILRHLMEKDQIQLGLLAGLADSRLSKAINAMHHSPQHPWTVDSLAAEANMSRAHFARRFHQVVGNPPGVYLNEWRISITQSLLKQGESVQLIADKVGYGSASALSRAFRSLTGQSPREWLNAG